MTAAAVAWNLRLRVIGHGAGPSVQARALPVVPHRRGCHGPLGAQGWAACACMTARREGARRRGGCVRAAGVLHQALLWVVSAGPAAPPSGASQSGWGAAPAQRGRGLSFGGGPAGVPCCSRLHMRWHVGFAARVKAVRSDTDSCWLFMKHLRAALAVISGLHARLRQTKALPALLQPQIPSVCCLAA